MKDYDCKINYHPSKVNIVVDALSCKSMHALKPMNANLSLKSDALAVELMVRPNLVPKILEAQLANPKVDQWSKKIEIREAKDFVKNEEGSLYFRDRFYVLWGEVKDDILKETHSQVFVMHLRATKMFQELRSRFWWSGMKRSIAEFVGHYLTCHQVKAKHQVLSSLSQPIPIPKWKWDQVIMDIVVRLP